MKIVVAIKQVPARDSELRIAASGCWIEEAGLAYEINEPDAYALEAGLRLKEQNGGEVIVLCAGPECAGQSIREASLDPLAVARLLSAAVRIEAPDLVLTGLESEDLGLGQTGVILAELLGLPHSTIIMEIEALSGVVRVKRELEEGWFQRIEMPLPALLAIQSGIGKLRYATLMGIRKAKSKEVRRLTADSLAVAPSAPSVVVDRVYLPERNKRTQLFTGDPKVAAAQLVEKLKFEVRAI
jgi:electron transfer flavoprotein beta subunit